MEKIHFYNTNTIYEGVTDFVKKNVLVINFKDVVPTIEEMANGFEILNENNDFVQNILISTLFIEHMKKNQTELNYLMMERFM